MTEPREPLNFDGIRVEDAAPPHRTPDHRASDGTSTVERPKGTGRFTGSLRDAIGASARGKARNVKDKPPKRTVPNRPGQFVERMEEFYMTAAMVVMPFDPEISQYLMMPGLPVMDRDTGEIIAPGQTGARRCAVAWDEAAQRNESVRRFLDSLLTMTVWGALIAAHVPILFAIAKNHTPLGARFDPAAAMEEFLRRQQGAEPQ